MTTFYICHCGNINFPHNFRHKFENKIKVKRKQDKYGDIYSLNVDSYPVIIKKKCGQDGCHYSEPIHGSSVLPHTYIPTEIKYREIKFTLPPDTKCRKCDILLKEHYTVETHHFQTKVNLKNKDEKDIVKIVHKDNDRKIIWD